MCVCGGEDRYVCLDCQVCYKSREFKYPESIDAKIKAVCVRAVSFLR